MVQKYATARQCILQIKKQRKDMPIQKPARNVSHRETHFFNFIIEPAADFLNPASELYIKLALQLNVVAKTLFA